jgi:hypothetical protein
MDTSLLKKFAQGARKQLLGQVGSRLSQVLKADSIEVRENPKVVDKLKDAIKNSSAETVIENVAYTWFNRFIALRFMDVNGFTRVGAVSPAEGFTLPEVLQEAKAGHIDEDLLPSLKDNGKKVLELLNGQANIGKSANGNTTIDPQQEAYRHLFIATCNHFHKIMPFLFEKIQDFTELLLPEDLLSEGSVLAETLKAIHKENCKDVEIIGWLYQYYISEKKDQVFVGLKNNKKITPENIPAATQLFTPNWIVRFLVENSLGRLWMLNRPNSKLVQQMTYYIKSDQPETNFLKISKPEELKICDPACGSGHMLVYAFDLLAAIYEEEGYEASEIPEKILSHNLFGIEIDERAGELAAFALAMKARAKFSRYFRKPTLPQICILEKISFKDVEIQEYMDLVGEKEISMTLQETLHQFEEADNFGSLIQPKETDIKNFYAKLKAKDFSDKFQLNPTHDKVLKILEMVEYLSPKYHVVIANPPYMGSKGMNAILSEFAKENYPESKSDLFAMFMERGFELVVKKGYSAMVTMQSWMFLSSYEKQRERMLNEVTIECMAHMANMVMGIAFGTAATVWKNEFVLDYKGAFCYIEYEDIGEGNKPITFPPPNERNRSANKVGK